MRRKLSYNTTSMVVILAISLFSAALLSSLQSADAQSQKANQPQIKKTKSANATAPIGNVQQLSKALGNNTKILASNVKIGTAPNFTKPKITAATPPSGPIGPTKGKSQSKSTSAGTSSSNMMNTTKAGGAKAANMTKAGGATKGKSPSSSTNRSSISSGPGKV